MGIHWIALTEYSQMSTHAVSVTENKGHPEPIKIVIIFKKWPKILRLYGTYLGPDAGLPG